MLQANYQAGDLVIYRKPKHSTSPGPRAINVHPTPHGDDYDYMVDKYWVVDEVKNDGTIITRTRRGKRHEIDSDDPHLRPASLWHRIVHRGRFPDTDPQTHQAESA